MTRFTVFGQPATKGSSVSFVGKDGRIVTKADCRNLAAWSQAVGWAARAARCPLAPTETPVHVRADFQFVRPKSVKRTHMTVKPDCDKLLRALLDSLTGVAYVDDAQVTEVVVAKRYAEAAQTDVTIQHG
jgi:crossover junction endodeoxyribonuclease RusA